MAEFCNTCAARLRQRPDKKPLLCEGCGLYFEKTTNILQWFKRLFK